MLYKMMFIVATTHLSSFPMDWEFCSIAVAVVLIWSMVFCADCLGRWSTSGSDTSDTNSQFNTNISYDITASDTVDLNEYDILNHGDVVLNNEQDILNHERDVLRNENVPNYASNNPVGLRPWPLRSQPIPIPPKQKESIDKYRLIVYSNATTAFPDVFRRENVVTPVTSEDSAIEIPCSSLE